MPRARSRAPTASNAPPVGSRIAVFWPLDNVFYPATVINALPDNRHVRLYGDKYKETLNLSTERFHALPSTPPPPSLPSLAPLPPPPPPPPPPTEPHSFLSLTHVPPTLPPRKRYLKHYRSKRSAPPSAILPDNIPLRIRIRRPAPPTRYCPSSTKPSLKLSSAKELLSEVTIVPPSPPTQNPNQPPELPRFQPHPTAREISKLQKLLPTLW